MKKEMLINVLQPEECRIAIIEDGSLEELYVERTSHESYVGNIYKGRIVNIEPSIQAAFVDFGVGRNGFLHVSDVEPAYYRHLEPWRSESENRRNRRHRDSDIDFGDDEENEELETVTADAEQEPAENSNRRGGRRRGGRGRRRGGGGRSDNRRGRGGRRGRSRDEDTNNEDDDSDLANKNGEADILEPEQDNLDDLPEYEPDDLASNEVEEDEIDQDTDAELEDDSTPDLDDEVETEELDEESGSIDDEDDSEDEEEESLADEEDEEEELEDEDDESTLDEEDEDEPQATSDDEDDIPPAPFVFDDEPKPAAKAKTEDDEIPPAPFVFDDDEDESEWSDDGPAAEDGLVAPFIPPDDDEAHNEDESEEPQHAFMDSTERRTDVEIDFSDEELSFSMARSEITSAPAEEEEVETEQIDEESEGDEEQTETAVELEEPEEEDDEPDERPQRRRDDYRRPPRNNNRRQGGGGGRGGRGRGGPRRQGRPGTGRPKPLIQDIFRKGQEVLVQVIKEGLGTKGPTLSTYISIAGRYLVLMPGLNRIGVSRKITDEDQRRRLRDVLAELKPPRGLGFIIRTAGMDRNKRELQRDLAYLSRLWQVVVRRIRKLKAPAEIYQESDMITRTIRDTFTSEIDQIWVDEEKAFEHAQEFLQIVMPRYASRINHYNGTEPMFHKYGIEHEIARIHQRHVPLPNGGSIVIDQTEALVAIDVNSGNFRADNNAEETAYQMNLLAAKEIARQLRLRDLGGVIVNDFIDMRDDKHRRGVERAMREAVKRDRARTKILKISAFGIVEMTRQRIRPSLKRSVYQDCPHCLGSGQVKTCESMSIEVMRRIQLAAHQPNIHRIEVNVAQEVATYLLNRKRSEIAVLEESGEIQIHIKGMLECVPPETLEFVCFDRNNNELKFPSYDDSDNYHRSRP